LLSSWPILFSARKTKTPLSDDILPRPTKDFCSFFHNPQQIFAHSSTSHNRFLRFLHVLPQPTTDFCTFFTFFHNPQSFLHFLLHPQQILALSSHSSTTHKDFCTSTTHNRFLQILPQNTKDFCCLLRLLLHHTNSIQFHSNKNNKTSNRVTKSACNLEQNFELGRQICAQSRTKLWIRLPNLWATFKQNFELDCQICVQSSNKTSNSVAKYKCNQSQTKLRIGFPNLCPKSQIGVTKSELSKPTQELKWKEKKTKTLIQALNFQNHKHQNHQPKSRISLWNLFTQISKCKQRNSKKLGTKFAQAKTTTPPSPTHQKK